MTTRDLSHADMWDVWVQLEDQMAECGMARRSYRVRKNQRLQPALRLAAT
jgi:hypothetical protein